jgi:hypothetical protein
MESEKVGAAGEDQERQPPRKSAIFHALRDLYSRYTRQERKQKKSETDHQRNERMMARWTPRAGYFTGFLVLFPAVLSYVRR